MASRKPAGASNSPNAEQADSNTSTLHAIEHRRGGTVRLSFRTAAEGDEELYVDVPETLFFGRGIGYGDRFTAAQLDDLRESARFEVARLAAVRLVDRAPQTAAGLQRKLEKRGHRRDAALASVERLQAHGLLDDEAFARAWVGSRTLRPKEGRLKLLRGLLDHGVDHDLATRILTEDFSVEAEEDAAGAVARTLAARHTHGGKPWDFARVARGLQQRGFPASVANRAAHVATGADGDV